MRIWPVFHGALAALLAWSAAPVTAGTAGPTEQLPRWVSVTAQANERIVHVDSTRVGCYELYYCVADDSLQGRYDTICGGSDVITHALGGLWIRPEVPSKTGRLGLPAGVMPADARGAIEAIRGLLNPGECIVSIQVATGWKIENWKFTGFRELDGVLAIRVASAAAGAERELRVRESAGRWVAARQ